MGDSDSPYDIEPKCKAVSSRIQYSHNQGLAKRMLKIEELLYGSKLCLKEEPA